MAYCTLTDIQALNAKRIYNTNSTPTAAQVGVFIDLCYARINTILSSMGYIVPVTEPIEFVDSLRLLNAQGAAAMAEQAMFPEVSGQGETPHWKALWDAYTHGLEALQNGEVPMSLDKSNNTLSAGSLYTATDTDRSSYPAPAFSIDPRRREF